MNGNKIIGIITKSKAGREAILAKRVIDATGDADVAKRAGVPIFMTPKEKMMVASVRFHVAGIDKAKPAKAQGLADQQQASDFKTQAD